ncbi:MAG: DUF4738 domain-containing protein [Prevotella sp.]
MKIKHVFGAAAMISILAMSCSEKKNEGTIITRKPVASKPAETIRMQDSRQNVDVEWRGKNYNVECTRTADTSLTLVKDDTGASYYDNTITLTVKRENGDLFFNKTFTKKDFASVLSKEYLDKNILLGLVFECAEGNTLRFAGSVGAADALSDEYVPLILVLSSDGNISISRDNRLDSTENEKEEDDGV